VGYVAVTAGEELIERAAELFDAQRVGEAPPITLDQLTGQLSRLTAQAMSEGGVYAPRLAALAVKQAQGDSVEAAFLLRAYRSTLERWDETAPISPDELFATRRVSPAYKDVPGGQILGSTKDYTQRLLDFDLVDEEAVTDPTADWDIGTDSAHGESSQAAPEYGDGEAGRLTNVMDVLRNEGLVAPAGAPPTEAPVDTTREPITHPPERAAVLQELARGETGAITALGYSALRGYGQVHPTLAEVRVGWLPVQIEHPYTGDHLRVTDIEVTETEAVVPVYEKRDDPQFAFGYGLTFGRSERKAIGMSILDASIALEGGSEPAENPEFVLETIDAMDAFGFIEHLKLPHYVTFESILDRIQTLREEGRSGFHTAKQDDTAGAGTESSNASTEEKPGETGSDTGEQNE
jgi:alpha-D-ribose 1-methylphosphonate 5-triphosphate synthase subunit PhnI